MWTTSTGHLIERERPWRQLFNVEEQELLNILERERQKNHLEEMITESERTIAQPLQQRCRREHRAFAHVMLASLQEPTEEHDLLHRADKQQRVALGVLPLVYWGLTHVAVIATWFLLPSLLLPNREIAVLAGSLLAALAAVVLADFVMTKIASWGLDRESVTAAQTARALRKEQRREIHQRLVRDGGSPEQEKQFWECVTTWGRPVNIPEPGGVLDELEQRFLKLEAEEHALLRQRPA